MTKKQPKSNPSESKDCSTSIGGDCFIHDVFGRSHKVKDLANLSLSDSPISVYGFNNTTWKMEKMNISDVKICESNQDLIKLTCASNFIEIASSQDVLVNRNGDLFNIEAKDIAIGDLVMVPKFLPRHEKNFSLNDVFPGKKSGKIKARSGSKIHTADVRVSVRFITTLAVISGMIDAGGFYDTKSGDVLFHSKSRVVCHLLASFLQDTFLVEPEVKNDSVRFQNKVVAMVIDSFLNNLASQNQEMICYYLSGYFHTGSKFGFVDELEGTTNKPFVSMPINNEVVFDRLRKSLLLFGIVPFRSEKCCTIIDSSHIEDFFTSIPILHKEMVVKVEQFMNDFLENPSYIVDLLGYKFGKSLSYLKSVCKIPENKYKKIECFEKESSIMSYLIADQLNSFIKHRFIDVSKSPISKLVDSSVVGVRVLKKENIGNRTSYSISCEKNYSFFINGILCYNN